MRERTEALSLCMIQGSDLPSEQVVIHEDHVE